MTLAIERPTGALIPRYAPGTFPCPSGVPWCNDEVAEHEPDAEQHFSGEMYFPVTAAFPHHKTGKLGVVRHPDRVSFLIAQTRQEDPTICLNLVRAGDELGIGDDAEMTLDEAEQLALFLLAQVAMLRGGESR